GRRIRPLLASRAAAGGRDRAARPDPPSRARARRRHQLAAGRAGGGIAGRLLFLHSSAGLYGADLQLAALAGGMRERGWEATAVLPERGDLADRLEQAGVDVVVLPLAVMRRRLLTPRGLARVAVASRQERGAL